MRLITILLLAAGITAAESKGQHGIFWLKDGRQVQGYWDPKSPLGSGIFVTSATNELLVDKRTGQVFVGPVQGAGTHIPVVESDIVDRSPPEGTFLSDPISIGEGSSETDISLLNKQIPTIPLSYIVTPKKWEEVFYLIEACRGEDRMVRIWQATSGYVKGKPSLIFLGEANDKNAQRGSKTLQALLISKGACLYDRTKPAPFWWNKQMLEAEAVARNNGLGVWSDQHKVWRESELGRQDKIIGERSNLIAKFHAEMDLSSIPEKGKRADAAKSLNSWMAMLGKLEGDDRLKFAIEDVDMLRLYADMKKARWVLLLVEE